jgi:hypothetical protein
MASSIFEGGLTDSPNLFCRGPDHMPCAATLIGARLDLIRGETRAAKSVSEFLIQHRRPG